VVENPIYVQNIKATVGIAQVIAAVKVALSRYHMVTFGIDNRTWKKSVVGDGRSDKAKIMKFAQAKWGDVFKEQDWADAACLAFWGAQRLGRMTNE
jgi:Holliday junction resolvasome RuvABC endonuclease subunit